MGEISVFNSATTQIQYCGWLSAMGRSSTAASLAEAYSVYRLCHLTQPPRSWAGSQVYQLRFKFSLNPCMRKKQIDSKAISLGEGMVHVSST